jgi:hypothetical protein
MGFPTPESSLLLKVSADEVVMAGHDLNPYQ